MAGSARLDGEMEETRVVAGVSPAKQAKQLTVDIFRVDCASKIALRLYIAVFTNA